MQKRKHVMPADAPASQAMTSSLADTLDEHEIAELAYRHWINRGCPMGSPEEDWFLAEQDLRCRSLFLTHK
jgi:hypothetical protein